MPVIILSSLSFVSIINKLKHQNNIILLCNTYDRHETIKINTIVYHIRPCEIIIVAETKQSSQVHLFGDAQISDFKGRL